MKKKTLALLGIFLISLPAAPSLPDRSRSCERLGFLAGEWRSLSERAATSERLEGRSTIEWILNGSWLQWRFRAEQNGEILEVLTLINYDEAERRVAFYSFNPFDAVPLPHYGAWLDQTTLRLETASGKEITHIDFRILADGDFEQIHWRTGISGEQEILTRTSYHRIQPVDR